MRPSNGATGLYPISASKHITTPDWSAKHAVAALSLSINVHAPVYYIGGSVPLSLRHMIITIACLSLPLPLVRSLIDGLFLCDCVEFLLRPEPWMIMPDYHCRWLRFCSDIYGVLPPTAGFPELTNHGSISLRNILFAADVISFAVDLDLHAKTAGED